MFNSLSIIGLDSTHEDEVAALMCETFLREPLTVAAGVPEERYLGFCREVFRQAVNENLAFGVLDGEKVVAFWMCEEDRSFQEKEVHASSSPLEEMEPIFELLERVHAQVPEAAKSIFGIQDLTREKILHMFMVGVRSTHTGRGITGWFTSAVLERAKVCGFTLATVEATNPGSEKPLLQLGFSRGGSVRYDKAPFDQIQRCDHCELLLKKI